MSGERMRMLVASVAVLLVLGAMFFAGEAQENQARLATARGQGTLRVGDERFKINSVIVKLIEDRKAEITLVSDITVFMEATWSSHGESREEFDLEVTGGASPGGVEGRGKVFLSSDGKTVTRLTVKGISRTTKRIVEANFEGK
jgi:hypothetical protein